MASYNELNALIDAYINRNGVQAITGQILNGVLKAMVEQLGRGYTIIGAAIPTTDPGTPDGPECYFASAPGTYTDFDGLQIVPGELALLCYTPSDGWTKETIYEGFQTVQATIDGNVGTPSVGVSYADGVLSFDFHNMKGNPGQNGQDGAAAGFGSIGADITGGVGTPGVTVESSGPATAKNLQFHFTNLKGETGVTSVVATVDNTTGNPACTVSLVGQQLTLAFSGLKGAQGDTGSSVDYPFTIVNNLTTNDATKALSAAQGVVLDGKVTQLEANIFESLLISSIAPGSVARPKIVNISDTTVFIDGYINVNNNVVLSPPMKHTEPIHLLRGQSIVIYSTQISGQPIVALTDEDGSFYSKVERVKSKQTYASDFSSHTSVFTALEPCYVSVNVYDDPTIRRIYTIYDGNLFDIFSNLAELFGKIQEIDGVVNFINYKNDSLFTDGGYIDTGGILRVQSDYSYTDYLPIPLKRDIKLIKCQTRNQYMNLISFYSEKSESSYISGLSYVGESGVYDYTVLASQIPEGAKYIRVSGFISTSSYVSRVDYSVNVLELLQANITKIEGEVSQLETRVSALENATQQITFNGFGDDAELDPNDVLFLPANKVKKNSVLSLLVDGAIQTIEVGVGYVDTNASHRTYDARWLEITPSTVKVYGYYNADPVLHSTYSHGLTLTQKTTVNIVSSYDVANSSISTKVVLSTDSGDTWEQVVEWGQGRAFVANKNTSGRIDVSLSFMPCDIRKKIWFVGDSYFDFWPKYVYQLGLYKWLRNSQPGLGPSAGYNELNNLLSLGQKPTYLVWCLGMNGAMTEQKVDGEYVINSDQKAYIDSVKQLCDQQGITVVFTTIPTVPTRQKNGFRSYILGLGVRYIDLYDAVGADEYGIWHGKPTLRGWTNNGSSVFTQIREGGAISVGHNVFDQNGNFLNQTISAVGENTIEVAGIVYTRNAEIDILGLLSTDGVHPTQAGAKVLAQRVINDFPEIGIDD